MTGNGLHRSGGRVWPLATGILVGVIATFAVYSIVKLYTVTAYSVSDQPVLTVLTALVCGLGALVAGALSGVVAGRRELLVASGSGLLGIALLFLIPDPLADPVILMYSSVPFLFLVAIGGEIVRVRRAKVR